MYDFFFVLDILKMVLFCNSLLGEGCIKLFMVNKRYFLYIENNEVLRVCLVKCIVLIYVLIKMNS